MCTAVICSYPTKETVGFSGDCLPFWDAKKLAKSSCNGTVIRGSGEAHRNKHFSRQKNGIIFQIFNQNRVLRVPLKIGY